jgi:proteasome-associated ATPase
MPTRVAANSAPAERNDRPGGSPQEAREKLEWYKGEKNVDALCNEALAAVNECELKDKYNAALKALNQKLREETDALTAYEHYAVVITDVERNGSTQVEVAGLRPGRVQIAVSPKVDPRALVKGATGYVSREGNCLLAVTARKTRWTNVGTFEDYVGADRILLRDRETLIVVDVAHHLKGVPLKKGDQVGFDRDMAGMAYERLDTPKGDHMFDENVTDDFALLGGLDKQIALIKQHIEFRVHFPALTAKYALKSRSGILLWGLPGNGKTRIGRCCAGHVRKLFPNRPCRFMHVSGSADYNMWFGESERRLRERFSAIREAAKDGLVIVLWDEIDAVARRRGSDHGSTVSDRILNTLLSEIDGVLPLSNVLLLLTSNRPETVDPSLLRPGRTDVKIEIPSPNHRGAEAILRGYISGRIPLNAAHGGPDEVIRPLLSRLYVPNGEYAEVARVKLSDGRRMPVAGRELVSGAMLENVVSVAAQSAAAREAKGGAEGVLEEDLTGALAVEMVGAVSLLTPSTVKNYVKSIPQDSQPIAIESLLRPR